MSISRSYAGCTRARARTDPAVQMNVDDAVDQSMDVDDDVDDDADADDIDDVDDDANDEGDFNDADDANNNANNFDDAGPEPEPVRPHVRGGVEAPRGVPSRSQAPLVRI